MSVAPPEAGRAERPQDAGWPARGPRKRQFYVALFAASIILSSWQLARFPGAGFGRYWEPVAVARSLAKTGSFANPFGALETGPTALLAPVFPAVLALLIRLFGDAPAFVLAASGLLMLNLALHAVLLPRVSRLFIGGEGPGIWAAALSIALPTFQMLPQWEAHYCATASMLFCLASARTLGGGERTLRSGIVSGVGGGLLLLLNPALVWVALSWVAFLIVSKRIHRAKAARFCGAFVLAAALVCLPWVVRNYRTFHAIFFLRNYVGMQLHVSNNDLAAPSILANLNDNMRRNHPNYSEREARLVRDLGEMDYDRLKMGEAADWIRRNPGRFLRLTLRRGIEFWFPSASALGVYAYTIWFFTAASVAGLALMARRRVPAVSFILAVFALYPLIYYLVQVDIRYRYPILWLSLLCAGYLAHEIAARVRRPSNGR